MKFFKRLAIRTGYDVFNFLSLIMMAAIYILPVILYMKNPPFGIIAAVLLLIAIIIRNQRAGTMGMVAFVTVIQLVLGAFAPIIIIVKIALNVTGKGSNINYEAQCWAGERRYDDERAREYGYKSVDDAINAGVLYDGTKLW